MKTININPKNPRQITAIPVIGFAEYKIIPKGEVKLYYEMKSDFFEQSISHNLTMTDEQFKEWKDDDYLIKLILENEKLEQIFIKEEENNLIDSINPLILDKNNEFERNTEHISSNESGTTEPTRNNESSPQSAETPAN